MRAVSHLFNSITRPKGDSKRVLETHKEVPVLHFKSYKSLIDSTSFESAGMQLILEFSIDRHLREYFPVLKIN